jgi:methylamine dehydrogenase accessory protein MauD
MTIPAFVSCCATWLAMLALGFLLLGALRSLELLRWRLDQLEATMPSKVNRSGLRPGARAPDFSLPDTAGDLVSLRDFAGRRVLLVFTQSGCRPCHAVMPELNRLQDAGEVQVLVVNNGEPGETRAWALESRARFPVLVQERYSLSRSYEVFASPFAFLIDENGRIASKGIINNRRQIGYVLDGHRPARDGHVGRGATGAERGDSKAFQTHSHLKEVDHV